jgi:hypothetical protein
MHATAVTYSDCLIRGLVVRPVIRLVARLIMGITGPGGWCLVSWWPGKSIGSARE